RNVIDVVIITVFKTPSCEIDGPCRVIPEFYPITRIGKGIRIVIDFPEHNRIIAWNESSSRRAAHATDKPVGCTIRTLVCIEKLERSSRTISSGWPWCRVSILHEDFE